MYSAGGGGGGGCQRGGRRERRKKGGGRTEDLADGHGARLDDANGRDRSHERHEDVVGEALRDAVPRAPLEQRLARDVLQRDDGLHDARQGAPGARRGRVRFGRARRVREAERAVEEGERDEVQVREREGDDVGAVGGPGAPRCAR